MIKVVSIFSLTTEGNKDGIIDGTKMKMNEIRN